MLVSLITEFSAIVSRVLIETCRETLKPQIFEECLVEARLDRFVRKTQPVRQQYNLLYQVSPTGLHSQHIFQAQPLSQVEIEQLMAALYHHLDTPVYKLLLRNQAQKIARAVTAQKTMYSWRTHSRRLKILEVEPAQRLTLALEALQDIATDLGWQLLYQANPDGSVLLEIDPCLNCQQIERVSLPVCDGINQLLLEMLRWFTNYPLFGSEIECKAEGAPTCLHRIRIVQNAI